jgi:hypothetical protein
MSYKKASDIKVESKVKPPFVVLKIVCEEPQIQPVY